MAEEPPDRVVADYKIPTLSELSPIGLKESTSIELERYTGCKSGPVCGPGYCKIYGK